MKMGLKLAFGAALAIFAMLISVVPSWPGMGRNQKEGEKKEPPHHWNTQDLDCKEKLPYMPTAVYKGLEVKVPKGSDCKVDVKVDCAGGAAPAITGDNPPLAPGNNAVFMCTGANVKKVTFECKEAAEAEKDRCKFEWEMLKR